MARYTYDAWGKVLSVTDADGNANTSSTFIGNVNPCLLYTSSAAVSRPGLFWRKLMMVASIGASPYRSQTGLSILSYSLTIRRMLEC